ncbi:hypothetical protein fh0823_07280 [Francisella halioticida]|uniref:Uncharacterized protein n=1 Tax=Francisella halioticida TaxID=549298 RepID=A0ABN5AW24_9GAMM|nr:hypothetical protein [Francisella halioticida]ASG67905.1 hypothetical protein CDV26_05460 [Francisella halioticida]BCD90589.1 hypothetical protein fh0823_07280 [Francisella halioticida]
MKKYLKKIIGKLNIPLIILLLIVGSLILVSNIKNEKVTKAKNSVNSAVNNISKKLNNAAQDDNGGSAK